jgi:hypothetical protein
MKPWMAVDAHNGGVEAQKMKPSKVCRPVDADSYHFNVDKDLDPDPYISEKSKPNFSEKMDPESGSALK